MWVCIRVNKVKAARAIFFDVLWNGVPNVERSVKIIPVTTLVPVGSVIIYA